MNLVIHTDGGARGNPGPAGIGVVFLADEVLLLEDKAFIGQKTNNEAEYMAFQSSVLTLKKNLHIWKPKKIEWKLDSLLVVEQLNRKWKIKEPRLSDFAQRIWQELATLDVSYTISHVPRAQNAAPDALVNQALDAQLS